MRVTLTRNRWLPRLQIMPTVMRIGPYRFHFYSREGNEPPHIHITREDMEAKFWLRPVALAANRGFASAELSRIHALVVAASCHNSTPSILLLWLLPPNRYQQ